MTKSQLNPTLEQPEAASRCRIEITEELIKRLYDAQLDFTQEMIGDPGTHQYSDDSFGDQMGALELSQVMTAIWVFGDTERLDTLLNSPADYDKGLWSYSQGIAPAFFDLNCLALED